MADRTTTAMRERVWQLKIDKTTEPPTILEEVEILNGELVEVRQINRPMTPEEVAAYDGGGGVL